MHTSAHMSAHTSRHMPTALTTHMSTQLVATFGTAFTFDAPLTTVPAGEEGFNIAVSGGTRLVMEGINFGSWDTSTSVSLGATGCGCASWYSSTSIRCDTWRRSTTVLGASLDAVPHIIVSSVSGTGAAATLSFDGPAVSYALGHQNAHAWKLTSVTVTGLNFGFSDRTVDASIPGYWGDMAMPGV